MRVFAIKLRCAAVVEKMQQLDIVHERLPRRCRVLFLKPRGLVERHLRTRTNDPLAVEKRFHTEVPKFRQHLPGAEPS
jgi:hypothetical protein